MNRLFATTAVALMLGLAPALAAEDSGKLADRTRRVAGSFERGDHAAVGWRRYVGRRAEQSSAPPNSAAGNTNSAEGGSMPD